MPFSSGSVTGSRSAGRSSPNTGDISFGRDFSCKHLSLHMRYTIMRHLTLFALLGLACAPSASALPLRIEGGVGYAAISGVRPYQAPDLTESDTSGVLAPYVRISTDISRHWSTGIGYVRLGGLKGHGVASSADIFHRGGPAPQVLTPFSSRERIDDWSWDVRFRWSLGPRSEIDLGPVVSVAHSRARIADEEFGKTEATLGAVAGLRYGLSKDWSLALGYRLYRPRDRTISILSLSLGFSR
jgi:hypothetical protein